MNLQPIPDRTLPPMPVHTPEDLLALLDEMGFETTTVEHEAAHTVEESKGLRGTIPGAHTKNLFVKDKKGAIFLITAREDTPVNLKHIHKHIGARGRVSFASAEAMWERLGVRPGSVTVFGLANDTDGQVGFVLDAALLEGELVNGHPMVNTATTTIRTGDLLAFVRSTGHEPTVLPLADL